MQLEQAERVQPLPWSLESLTRRHFRSFPPGEASMEAAIASVEDALMPLLPVPAHGTPPRHLQVPAPWLRAFAEVAAAEPGAPLTLAQVEQVFNQLVAVASGSPARSQGVPEDLRWCMAVLLVREALHHGGMAAVEAATATPLRAG